MKEGVVRNLLAVLVVAVMGIVSSVVGDRELIFPELGALAVGLLVVPKQVWHVGSIQLVLLMGGAAAIGWSLVRWAGVVGYGGQALIAVAGVALLMYILGVSVPPAIAAAVLPVLTEIDSELYVISVVVMSVVVVIMQGIERAAGVRSVSMGFWKRRKEYTLRDLKRWLLILLCLVPLVVVSVLVDWRFLIAPPLIVTLVEFSVATSGFRHRPWQVLFLIVFASAVGTTLATFCGEMGLSPLFYSIPTYIIVLGVFSLFVKPFAPAAATCLLPMVIPVEDVWLLPIEVLMGGAYVILISAIPNLVCKRSKGEKGGEGKKGSKIEG